MKYRIREPYTFYRASAFLCLFALSLCYCAFALVEMVLEQGRVQNLKEINTTNSNMAHVVEENVRRLFSQADSVLLFVKVHIETQGAVLPGHLALLREFLQIGVINQIAVADQEGNLIFSAVPLEKPLNISHREHFLAQMESDTKKMYIASPWMSRATKTDTIFLSRRVNDAAGNFGGIVSVGIDQSYFNRVFSPLELGAEHTVTLLRTDGSLLARVPPAVSERLIDSFHWHPVLAYVEQGLTSGLYHRETERAGDGIARIGAFRKLPDYPLIVLSTVTKAYAEKDLLGRTKNYGYWANAFSGMVLLSFSIIWLQMRKQYRTETQLRIRERDLAVGEARYRGLFEHLQRGFAYHKVIVNDAGRAIDIEIVDANPAFIEASRLTTTEIIGKRASEIFPAIDKESLQFIQTYGEVGISGRSEIFEHYFSKVNKWLRIIAYSPEPGYVAILSEDISDRKFTEEALNESREHFKALVKQSREAVIVYDLATGQIVEVNAACVKMFGYSEEELLAMSAQDIHRTNENEWEKLLTTLVNEGGLVSEYVHYRHKDGQDIYVERTGSFIQNKGRHLALLSHRDVARERTLQNMIHKQVEMAGVFQRGLIQGDYEDDLVSIRTIYEPLHLVSGDYYGYRWSADNRFLHGYVLDIMGHGMATALQTATISTLLQREMEKIQLAWSVDLLQKLNKDMAIHLPEGSFAAMMVFTFDFERRTLTYVSGGIHELYVSTQSQMGRMTAPGSLLGIGEQAEFDSVTIPIQHGDTFYFITDGISEKMAPELAEKVFVFESSVEAMKQLAHHKDRHDDASAVCIAIRGFKRQPLYFEYINSSNRKMLRPRIRKALEDMACEDSTKVKAAVAEAVINGLKYGTKVIIKINQIGTRIVVRVRDNGPGFAGNAAIADMKIKGLHHVFAESLLAESGRGIAIMVSWMDRVLYSKLGNEVMLVKKIAGTGKEQ